ncbi:hypothetical protein SAMN05216480_10787 [Pustulibacterium marinum]|uniref:Lipocalin-like domain-containing protein n=1 Tax=Pustulibacterium marinum TaxID=1224947 RepID=A0A1I7H5I0_9FLAO|nr:hypothetical protein [Pustulibacterium marinum]SFU55965.1 hypothetical protein SAMN05216480_10787 [Pustulibacterium marinum]
MKLLKTTCILVLIFSAFSCEKSIPKDVLTNLNGYWEIEKAEGKDGMTKVYKVNTTIDHIELDENLSGTRRKVKPVIGSDYLTSGDAEKIEIVKENDAYYIHYKNDQSEWNETLLSVDENHFSTKNSNTETTFFYKRYEPITVE